MPSLSQLKQGGLQTEQLPIKFKPNELEGQGHVGFVKSNVSLSHAQSVHIPLESLQVLLIKYYNF